MMRYKLVEALIIGGLIGVGVMLVRTMMADAPQNQIMALIVIAVVLCGMQISLMVHHAHQNGTDVGHQTEQTRSARLREQNPFLQELDDSWTGLVKNDTAPAHGQPPDDAEAAGQDD